MHQLMCWSWCNRLVSKRSVELSPQSHRIGVLTNSVSSFCFNLHHTLIESRQEVKLKDLEADFELTFEFKDEHDKEKSWVELFKIQRTFLTRTQSYGSAPHSSIFNWPIVTLQHNAKKQNAKAKSDRLSLWENCLLLTNFWQYKLKILTHGCF